MAEGPRLMRLSHIAIEVADVSTMTEFYRDLWGLEVSEEDRGSIFLRSASPDHHAVGLYPGTPGRVHHVGFEVESRDDLERLASVLSATGQALLYGPGPSLDEPGVDRVVRFADPDGNVLEAYTGMAQIRDPYGPRNVVPQGLNHVVLNVSDLQRSEKFYAEVLGLRVSDWIQDFMTFMRCNPNHHSLALKQGVPGLDHAAFTTLGWEEISRGVFHLGEHRVQRLWGPGRHGPGNNLFAYFFDPENNIVEYTADIVQVDEASWTPRIWPKEQGNLWPGSANAAPGQQR